MRAAIQPVLFMCLLLHVACRPKTSFDASRLRSIRSIGGAWLLADPAVNQTRGASTRITERRDLVESVARAHLSYLTTNLSSVWATPMKAANSAVRTCAYDGDLFGRQASDLLDDLLPEAPAADAFVIACADYSFSDSGTGAGLDAVILDRSGAQVWRFTSGSATHAKGFAPLGGNIGETLLSTISSKQYSDLATRSVLAAAHQSAYLVVEFLREDLEGKPHSSWGHYRRTWESQQQQR